MPVFSLGTMGSFAMTTTTDQTVIGSKTFMAGSAASVPLRVRGATGQTANIFEIQTPAGVNAFYYRGSDGAMLSAVNTNWYITPNQTKFSPVNATSQALIVQGFASQTANIQEWQDSAGTVLSGVGNTGFIYVGAAQTTFMSAVNGRVQAQSLHPVITPLTVKGAVAQTANLQEWQNSAGTSVTTVTASGDFNILGTGAMQVGLSFASGYIGGTISSYSRSTSEPAIIGKGRPGQTAPVISAQNSAGNDVWNINADAAMGLTRTSIVPATNGGYGYLYVDAGGNLLYKSSAGNIRTVAAA